ncbi:MAG: transglutaminase family protein [Ilumatobacteraceae bacterium]
MESGSESSALIERFSHLIERGADLPLDETALVIAATLAPQDRVDIRYNMELLDRLADSVPDASVTALSATLFGNARVADSQSFVGNREDYYAATNSLLHRVLAERRGIPITLSLLAIEVGRRCGLPLSGVGMPAHFIVGVTPDQGLVPETFIDPFNGGAVLDRVGCRNLFHRVVGAHQSFDSRFLAITPALGIVERMLNNLKAIYTRQGDTLSLRKVMILRSRLPGIGAAESDERLRSMAPFN